MNMPNYTELYIKSLESGNGGWSKISLKKMGLDWPPKKGWKKQLIANDSLNPLSNTALD